MAGSTLEHLRIVSESAACLGVRPQSEAARWRRDESIRWAACHHSVGEVAEAAGIATEEIWKILEPEGATPLQKSSGWRRGARHFLPAFR
jgi:hypothetical protein